MHLLKLLSIGPTTFFSFARAKRKETKEKHGRFSCPTDAGQAGNWQQSYIELFLWQNRR